MPGPMQSLCSHWLENISVRWRFFPSVFSILNFFNRENSEFTNIHTKKKMNDLNWTIFYEHWINEPAEIPVNTMSIAYGKVRRKKRIETQHNTHKYFIFSRNLYRSTVRPAFIIGQQLKESSWLLYWNQRKSIWWHNVGCSSVQQWKKNSTKKY